MSSTAINSRHGTPGVWVLAFLVVVIGVGGLIGTQTAPGGWYEALQKPPFNPPNWVFGPVWFALYVLIAIAGWRVFLLHRAMDVRGLWVAQMLLNWAWSPTWFGLRQVWPAFAIIAVLLCVIVAFIWRARRVDRPAAAMFVPYAAWVGFAGALNLAIAILN